MSILDIFNLTWKPREGIIYRNKIWGRHKNLVWLKPMWQGQPPFPIGKRRQNISKVYVELDKIRYSGSFQVKGNVCTFGILNHRHITELYKTDRQNVKFLCLPHTLFLYIMPSLGFQVKLNISNILIYT